MFYSWIAPRVDVRPISVQITVSTIGEKNWDSVLKYGNLREQKNHTPTPPLHPKLGCLFFLQVAPTAAQHCMEGIGEEKLYFPLLKLVKRQKAPFRFSVSTNFVACGSCTVVGSNISDKFINYIFWGVAIQSIFSINKPENPFFQPSK